MILPSRLSLQLNSRGAIYAPEAGYINDPQLAAHNLRCAVEALGGEFKLRRSVVAINQGR